MAIMKPTMFLLFFAFWLILNGKCTLEICLFGVAVSALLFAFMCGFMNYSFKKELKFYRCLPLFIAYGFVVVKEIFVANWNVLFLVYSRRMESEPAFVFFKPELHSPILQMLLANSITITPGTITVQVNDGVFCVHCLDKSYGDGIENSVFVKLLTHIDEVLA